jgi:hypothetical protein
LVEGGGLIPVTADDQEAADRGGYRDGMPGVAAGGGVVRGGVQVRALCFQPGGRLPEGRQVRACADGLPGSGRSGRTCSWLAASSSSSRIFLPAT